MLFYENQHYQIIKAPKSALLSINNNIIDIVSEDGRVWFSHLGKNKQTSVITDGENFLIWAKNHIGDAYGFIGDDTVTVTTSHSEKLYDLYINGKYFENYSMVNFSLVDVLKIALKRI